MKKVSDPNRAGLEVRPDYRARPNCWVMPDHLVVPDYKVNLYV
jgi:hypothetical protein